MNMKKMKKFFTLSRRAEGFTLVELIVVIAILAILGGVAVPAYSGYVKKANMQADMTLISEIEQALQLAYYSQDLTEGKAGFIILSPNAGETDCEVAGSPTDVAMQKVFGSNWRDTIQLKYSDWGIKNMMLGYEDATAVVNSNYVQKYTPNELMEQVQALTSVANGLEQEIGGNTITMHSLYNYTKDDGTTGNAIDDLIEEYYDGTKSWDDFNATQKSNLLVLATADSINSGKKENTAAMVIPEYALYAAYAAEDPEFNTAYVNFQNTIQNTDPTDEQTKLEQISAAFSDLQTAANNSGYNEWKSLNEDTTTDAFNAIMTGVGNAMLDNRDAILNDLGNENMFTSGVGSELYGDYLNSAYAAAGMEDVADQFLAGEAPEGSVLIQYVVNQGKLYIVNSLPNS